jgi:hypothetical protein
LVSRFNLTFELGKIAIGLRFRVIAGDYLDDVFRERMARQVIALPFA